MSSSEGVLVVGGGVVGICCAYYLAESGVSVTLVERDRICSGCSYGNAGLIVPSHSVPLATSGTLVKALKSLMTDGPFRISKTVDWELVKWLFTFALACNSHKARRSMYVLRDLIRSSVTLYEGLASRIDFGYANTGSLALFATKHGFESGQRDADALGELGIDSRVLDASGLAEADPLLSAHLEGAVRYPQDAQLSPSDFGKEMAKLASGLGVRIKTGVEVIGFELSDRAVEAVRTTAGESRPATVVIAAGAWSSLLARQLGLALPIQAGKGYSLSVDSSEFLPKAPLLLGETKVAITPMGRAVRLTGRFELSGLDTSINIGRVQSILHSASLYFRNPLPAVGTQLWSGLRPCTPDGLPVISRSAKLPNVVVAAGHGMLGVTLGPITGKMVSDLIREKPLDIHGSELSIERFE